MNISSICKLVIEKLPHISWAFLVFLALLLVAFSIRKVLRRVLTKSAMDESLINMLTSLAFYTVVLFDIICVLGTLGIDVSALIAGLGLTGFALGFALKDAIGNLISGVLILFYRPFKVGSRINVIGYEGTVKEIDLRYTKIVSDDNTLILVPNTKLFQNPVKLIGGSEQSDATP